MKEPENKKHKILNRAWRLFLRQGFTKTSMRAIAEDAGVSLGLLTYYFTTKDNIALELLEKQIADFKAALNRVIDLDEDPVLYSASLVRLNYKVMSMPEFRVFYLDAMRNDLYFKTIPNRRLFPDRGLESLSRINDKYRLGHRVPGALRELPLRQHGADPGALPGYPGGHGALARPGLSDLHGAP